MSNPKTIKLIGNQRFEVELHQMEDGGFRIKYCEYYREEYFFSELIPDFNMASFLFDMKVQELEGQ